MTKRNTKKNMQDLLVVNDEKTFGIFKIEINEKTGSIKTYPTISFILSKNVEFTRQLEHDFGVSLDNEIMLFGNCKIQKRYVESFIKILEELGYDNVKLQDLDFRICNFADRPVIVSYYGIAAIIAPCGIRG